MKPRTKMQKRVAELSEHLPPLTEAQICWIKRDAFSKEAYRCKKNTWCTSCGHVFLNDFDTCPHCGAKLKVVASRATKKQEKVYATIHTTCKGFQVARHFLAKRLTRKNNEPQYQFNECVQVWISCNGQQTIVARPCCYHSFYVDLWDFYKPMTIKKEDKTWRHRYDIFSYSNKICRVLPVLYRNGFDGDFHNITPTILYTKLLTSYQAEILIKSKQYALLQWVCQGGDIRCFHAVKVCNRNGYIVKDAPTWLDYISLLEYHGLDTHNAHYVCPGNLKREHDRLQKKKDRIEHAKLAEKQREEMLAWEKDYMSQKGKYFGLSFNSSSIKVSVFTSVRQIEHEGNQMHHCVFSMGYYKKPESLLLTAQDTEGHHLETVEINLDTFKVVQSRGLQNSLTQQHDEIISLCKKNMYKIQQISRQ